MDQESEKKLAEITAKDPGSLLDSEKDILRARISYLNAAQVAVFSEVLGISSAIKAKPAKARKGLNKDLLKIAEELGILVPEDATEDSLRKLIEDTEKANKEAEKQAETTENTSDEGDQASDGDEEVV